MVFIYEFYPEYGSEPDFAGVFTWLHDQAMAAEQTNAMSSMAYSRPNRGKNSYTNYSNEDSEDSDEGNYGLGTH